MALRLYGVSHSSSTLNADAIAYLKEMGYSTGSHWTRYVSPILSTDSILGIKYVIQDNENNYGLTQIGSVGELFIYENEHAMPVCFPVSSGYTAYDAELERENPFDLQNRMLSAMVGSDEVIEFYRPLRSEDVEIVFENVAQKQYGEGYMKYYIEETGRNSHIEFLVPGQENMTLYAAFPSSYPRKVNIWINREWYNTYLSSSTDDGIIPLGKYAEGEQVSLIMTILSKEDNKGSGEVFLRDKLFYARPCSSSTSLPCGTRSCVWTRCARPGWSCSWTCRRARSCTPPSPTSAAGAQRWTASPPRPSARRAAWSA